MLYPSAGYSDHGFLQMTLGYLSPSSGTYKSVDPYFLSQGRTIPSLSSFSLAISNTESFFGCTGQLPETNYGV